MNLKSLSTGTLIALSMLVLAGCATTSGEDKTSAIDPFEQTNRATFEFNDKFDKRVFRPVAQVYADNTPSFVQTGIGNFFGNFNDIWTGINSFLQGNVEDGFTDFMRVGINSTFGFLGVLDIASEANIPKHRNDLGQTLGVWGVPNGPYLVLPFLGPSVTRDTVALPVDYYGDVFSYVRPVWVRNSGDAIRLVDKRAGYLGSFSLLQAASLDEYIFVRDAYLQRIAGQIETRKNHKQNKLDEEEMRKQNEEDDANAKADAAGTSAAPASSEAKTAAAP
ncbi:phospholipid-binding lipoprotein MlaA [Oxalobacteraceae bacterium GrIS 2.11]